MQNRRGIAWLLVAATGYGSLVVLIKWAVACGLNGETAMGMRFTIAALTWWIILLVRRRAAWPGGRQVLRALAIGALLYTPNSLAYYYGTARATGTVAAIAVAAVPVMVALLAGLFLRERLGRASWLALGLTVIGGVMLAGGRDGRADALGLLLLGTAVLLYSAYIVASTPLVRAISPPIATCYIVTGAAGCYWLWGGLSGRMDFAFAPPGWAAVVSLALLPTVLAMFAFLTGAEIVGATRAAIVNGLEPFVGVLLSVLFLGDRPGIVQLLGGGLVILAAVLVQRERARGDAVTR